MILKRKWDSQSAEDKTFDASEKYMIGTRTKLVSCRIRLKTEKKTFFVIIFFIACLSIDVKNL